jgi:hypothetical protein
MSVSVSTRIHMNVRFIPNGDGDTAVWIYKYKRIANSNKGRLISVNLILIVI